MYMKENTSVNEKRWIQEGNHITNGKRIIHIGDYVDYKPHKRKYTGKWIAIGATDDGNLMIMSEDPISTLKLGGKDGVATGVKRLNTICKKYASGDDAAHVRSLTVEDVEKIFHITKEFDESTLEIRWTGIDFYQIANANEETQLNDFCHTNKFCFWDRENNQWREYLNSFKKETITNFKIYSHVTHVDELYAVDKKLRKQICNSTYWLASPSVSRFREDIRYGLHLMTENLFSTNVSMVAATGEEYGVERAGVRAVVYLASNVELEPVKWNLIRSEN